eukprot:c24304_g1_i1 orf=950-1147(+)
MQSGPWSSAGFSALHYAEVYGKSMHTVGELLKHDLYLCSIKDGQGHTPFDWLQVVDLPSPSELIL